MPRSFLVLYTCMLMAHTAINASRFLAEIERLKPLENLVALFLPVAAKKAKLRSLVNGVSTPVSVFKNCKNSSLKQSPLVSSRTRCCALTSTASLL